MNVCDALQVVYHKCNGLAIPCIAHMTSPRTSVSDSAPYLQSTVIFTTPLQLEATVGESIEFEGILWKITGIRQVPTWGRTFAEASAIELTGVCIKNVLLHQWAREYGCDGVDVSELVTECLAVIHHVDSERVNYSDGSYWRQNYRIFFDVNTAKLIRQGWHVVDGDEVYDIDRVSYLEDLGHLPYAEAFHGLD